MVSQPVSKSESNILIELRQYDEIQYGRSGLEAYKLLNDNILIQGAWFVVHFQNVSQDHYKQILRAIRMDGIKNYLSYQIKSDLYFVHKCELYSCHRCTCKKLQSLDFIKAPQVIANQKVHILKSHSSVGMFHDIITVFAYIEAYPYYDGRIRKFVVSRLYFLTFK